MKDQIEKRNGTMGELVKRLNAGFTMFWMQTDETLRAARSIDGALKSDPKAEGYTAIVWDYETEPDELEALNKLDTAANNTVSILVNFHWFLRDPASGSLNFDICQRLINRAESYAGSSKAVVILSNETLQSGCPSELQPFFTALRFELPNEDDIKAALDYAIECAEEDPNFKMPDEETKAALIKAAKGLTAAEVENSLLYSAVSTGGEFQPEMVSKIKAKIVESEAGLEYSEFGETFDSLKGYDALKQFTKATIGSEHARGILLLGPPGTGKSHFCKCLGNETGLPVLAFEMGSVFGSLVGESEKKMRRVIDIIKAMSPCIVFVDEIEKGLSGASGSSTDGGTTQRTMAIWLKFMSDRPAGIYIVGTCNDINSIPPEYLRAERWDTAPFFIDLPNEVERTAILDFYRNEYKVEGNLDSAQTDGWSGAELKAVCRIATMMEVDLAEAKKFVIPISVTMGEQIKRLRDWSKGRALPASTAKVKGATEKKARKVKL